MWKLVGSCFVLGGVAGTLYSWICAKKESQKRIEEFVQFIHKSIFAMETEKIKIIDYFLRYRSDEDKLLEHCLHEVAIQLQLNTYATGQEAWEEVFIKKKQVWELEEELFQSVLQTGQVFFGRSRQENISMLRKKLMELEILQQRKKEKNIQENKLWIPLGMLGGVMTIILFL